MELSPLSWLSKFSDKFPMGELCMDKILEFKGRVHQARHLWVPSRKKIIPHIPTFWLTWGNVNITKLKLQAFIKVYLKLPDAGDRHNGGACGDSSTTDMAIEGHANQRGTQNRGISEGLLITLPSRI